tara:strand:+ start:529 stop:909 length:381 start_codon:yes stop_codon:yes gene_type:complete
MFDQMKPDINQMVSQQHTRRKLDSHEKGVFEMPHFNYHTKSVEVGCTAQSLKARLQTLRKEDTGEGEKMSRLFRSPNEADLRQEAVTAKVGRLEHDMKILEELFDEKYVKRKAEEAKGGRRTTSTT